MRNYSCFVFASVFVIIVSQSDAMTFLVIITTCFIQIIQKVQACVYDQIGIGFVINYVKNQLERQYPIGDFYETSGVVVTDFNLVDNNIARLFFLCLVKLLI